MFGPQGPPGPSVSVASVTALSAVPDATFTDGTWGFVTLANRRALWQIDRTSVLTPDGVKAAATQSGVGRWVLRSFYRGNVPATEVGADATGVADATASLTSAVTSLAGTGAALTIPGGTFGIKPLIATGVAVASNTEIKATASTTINAAVPAGDGHTDSPFFVNWQNYVTSAATVAATVVEGAVTIQVSSVANLPTGTYFTISPTGFQYSISFLVRGVGATGTVDITQAGLYGPGGTLNGKTLILDTGSGPTTLNLVGSGNASAESTLLAAIYAQWPALHYALQGPGSTGKNLILTANTLVVGAGSANSTLGLSTTLNTVEVDIPVDYPVPSGTEIDTFTPTTGLHIDFDGATISGTGGRAFWFVGCWGAVVENGNFNCSFTTFGPDFDFGGRGNVFRNIRASRVAGCTNAAFSHESGQAGLYDRCEADGLFPIGFMVAGIGHVVRDCRAFRCAEGLSLQHIAAIDTICARYCTVEGGQYDGSGTWGVIVQDNSFGNRLVGVSATGNAFGGFALQTGGALTSPTGVNQNTLVGCVATGNGQNGNYAGFFVGTVSGGPYVHDGNTFDGCIASGNNCDGFGLTNGATNTTFTGCQSKGNVGNGYSAGGTNTAGAVYSGCVSEGNGGNASGGYGWVIGSACDVTLSGCSSINDVGGGFDISSSAPVTITGARLVGIATGAGWLGVWMNGGSGDALISKTSFSASGAPALLAEGVWHNGSGAVTCSEVSVSGMTYAFLITGGGVLNLSYCKATGSSGTVGIYAGAGKINIGPGCDFSGVTTAISFQGGTTLTMVQTGGVAAITGGAGTTTMTFAQHYSHSIEIGNGSPISSGSQTLNAYGAFIGQEFTVKNYNTGSSTTTVFGIVVPVGATYRIRCNAAGTWEHVTYT